MALVIHSPAPPATHLHRVNAELVRLLTTSGDLFAAEMAAVPLPDSINRIAALSGAEKARHLPIVTSIDLLPAIRRQAPDWHAYDCVNHDLKLATSLYDVAFGVLSTAGDISTPDQLRGRRIGAPPRPSSVRWLTEVLLRDGWGILDDVELVDVMPSAVPHAIASGRIDATTWNLVTIGPETISSEFPELLSRPVSRWIDVDGPTITKINAANPFKISGVTLKTGESAAKLLSFRQGLAVWTSTPDDVVNGILETLQARGMDFAGLPRSVREMANWPFLTKELLHVAALDFFQRNGVEFDWG